MPYKNAEQQLEYQRQWIASRRAAFFTGKACVVCGSTDRLELDHKDRVTKDTHRIWSWSVERQEVEIAKCQVLCHGCHLDKTRTESLAICGTNSSYRRGCRCDLCRSGHRASVYAWRAKTGKH